ncbi:hypothetical protein LHYA1_G004475 [Lachnellula hyalina]|uniref:Uncharacterized protein n=1 Tax=Lachnellula hyalina TaxID=1316788 RepID=A0A8H8R4N7_9HELO|nr:uncharacterized protein LHYA1_G004475 [Lachnellula hyalina]TVY28368.1 hypothetical protein LHYA1_G004475 [Lachnellula hyalina]
MVLEFPTSRNGWKLDAVGLLAVIGETTTEKCAEPMTASYLCLLPRLIPAPQALIRPNRRESLARVPASIVGVHTGMVQTQLPYIANQIHPIADIPPYAVIVLEITHHPSMHPPRTIPDDESGTIGTPVRRTTNLERIKSFIPPRPQPLMKTKAMAPHNVLSVLSTFLTIALLIWAIVIGDGAATIAIVLLSCATTLFCAAALWSPPNRLPTRHMAPVPPGDVVIRTGYGAFLIIKCDENVARELYFGTEEVVQVITRGFGSCVGAGTVVFMVAVIMMGNCSWTMQAALAVTYLVLNAVYWFAALLPSKTHWEFPRYQWRDFTPEDAKYQDVAIGVTSRPSFTRSLWRAILETKSVGWVRKGGAAPNTPIWNEWLDLAEMNAQNGNRRWPFLEEKKRIEDAWMEKELPKPRS